MLSSTTQSQIRGLVGWTHPLCYKHRLGAHALLVPQLWFVLTTRALSCPYPGLGNAEQAHRETKGSIEAVTWGPKWWFRTEALKAKMTISEPKMMRGPRQIHAMNCSDSSAAWKENRQLSLLTINSGGYYPFPSLAMISAAAICPTLVIIDITLNHTRIIESLPLHWSSREDAILNHSTSQNSTPMSCWARTGDVYWDALTTKYSCSP